MSKYVITNDDPNGYGLCYNNIPSYQLRNGINPDYDLAQCCTLDSGTYSGNLGRSR